MSAKVINNCFVQVSEDDVKTKPGPTKNWPVVAVCGFVGSGICFAVGLMLSALAGLGAVTASRTTAYITVGILLGAFALAFVGAHAMDRSSK